MADPNNKQGGVNVGAQDDFNELGKKGLFGRFNRSINEAIQTGRGTERPRDPVAETADAPQVTADDLAIRRARNVNPQKMFIPEGVIIEGNLTGGSDTEICGRITGDITVDGRLVLGSSALVSGSVRAGSCRVEGLVEGKVECVDELELGNSGRLNADVIAGKRINILGQVYGNVITHGVLRLGPTARIDGDVRARNIQIEEGAALNGQCIMRAPSEKAPAPPQGGGGGGGGGNPQNRGQEKKK